MEETIEKPRRTISELIAVCEALIFVADEPLPVRTLIKILQEDSETIEAALEALQIEYEERESGLQIREIGGGWQISTRTEFHEEVREFLKIQPSAKLSLASLETLAVIAYKQPVTVPEIMEIRGVQSASSIKTLLDKRLITAKGRKETIGKPMQYGTSKDFMIQFGLKDLSELPSIEDFEDLVQ
jgi:segregation and condensation protein B